MSMSTVRFSLPAAALSLVFNDGELFVLLVFPLFLLVHFFVCVCCMLCPLYNTRSIVLFLLRGNKLTYVHHLFIIIIFLSVCFWVLKKSRFSEFVSFL